MFCSSIRLDHIGVTRSSDPPLPAPKKNIAFFREAFLIRTVACCTTTIREASVATKKRAKKARKPAKKAAKKRRKASKKK
jgi:hypothetical protein